MNKILLTLMMVFVCTTALATTTVTKTYEASGGDYGHLNDCVAYFAANYPNFVTSDINGVCTSGSAWGSADTTAVSISGLTTDSTHTFTITTTGSARHDGRAASVSGRSNYRIVLQYDDTNSITIAEGVSNVLVDGVEFYRTSSARSYPAIQSIGSSNIIVSNNLIHDFIGGSGNGAIRFYFSTGKILNNIIYKTGNGGISVTSHNPIYIYNNTLYGSTYGIYVYLGGYGDGSVLKNNIAYNNTTDYSSELTNSSSTNNLSKDTTAPAYNTYYVSKTLTFANVTAGSEDFHLVSTDTDAIDKGADLSGTFTTDIDGTTRTGTWDIGADEYVATSSGVPMATSWLISGMSISGESFK